MGITLSNITNSFILILSPIIIFIALPIIDAYALHAHLAKEEKPQIQHQVKQHSNLPKNLISYNSSKGIQLFNAANYKKDFWPLSRFFITQANQSFCGIASLVMVLNAIALPYPLLDKYGQYKIFTQENVFTKKVLTRFHPNKIAKSGLTLKQLAELSQSFDIQVQYFHAIPNKNGLSLFKRNAIKTIQDDNSFIIVNFFRQKIGEIGNGHFSPLAAYDVKSDRFLLMDVSRYKYPPTWIKGEDIWKSMSTIDQISQQYRGYIILSKGK